jgi:uncharacterized protein
VYEIDWKREPDIDCLREAYDLLHSDPEAAVSCLKRLAEKGSLCSMWYLADAYSTGEHISKNIEAAAFWYTRGAEAGWRPGFYLLGRAYLQLSDERSAFNAFSRGASMGYVPSIYRLAKMHQDGRGTTKDINRARELLEVAESKGHLFARRDLAILYITCTFGVPRAITGLRLIGSLTSDLIKFTVRQLWRRDEFEERILA